MRKNSIKNTRVNGAVLKELSTIIHSEIKDPRIHPMTSVTAVEVAPDLKTCKAYISVLGEKAGQRFHHPWIKERRGLYPERAGQKTEPPQYAGDPFCSG